MVNKQYLKQLQKKIKEKKEQSVVTIMRPLKQSPN